MSVFRLFVAIGPASSLEDLSFATEGLGLQLSMTIDDTERDFNSELRLMEPPSSILLEEDDVDYIGTLGLQRSTTVHKAVPANAAFADTYGESKSHSGLLELPIGILLGEDEDIADFSSHGLQMSTRLPTAVAGQELLAGASVDNIGISWPKLSAVIGQMPLPLEHQTLHCVACGTFPKSVNALPSRKIQY